MKRVISGRHSLIASIENAKKEDSQFQSFTEMKNILSSLASVDALKILHRAKEGIRNSSEVIKNLSLTQKKYYTRLKMLINSGLIEKRQEEYCLTFLGNIIYEILYRKIEKAIENRDRLALIDKLKKADSLSKEEKEQIESAISIKDEIVGYSDLFGTIKPVSVILTWDDMVNAARDLIINAQEEILLATRYTETQILEDVFQSINRGIKFYALDGDKANLSERMQILRVFLTRPKTLKLLYQSLNSQNLRVRYTYVPFSFFVVDKKKIGFEIINPHTQDFLFAVILEDEKAGEKLIRLFNQIFEASQNDPLQEFFTKQIDEKTGTS